MYETYYPVVVAAIPGKDHTVYAYFTDGTIHLFDAKPLIAQGGVFSPMRDETFFENNLTVLNDTVAWDLSGCFDPKNCIDIDPFAVHDAPTGTDPLFVPELGEKDV